MGRIAIDLPDAQIEKLATLAEMERRTMADVIHDAIEAYIVRHKRAQDVDVFALWKHRKLDGLDYQQKLRSDG